MYMYLRSEFRKYSRSSSPAAYTKYVCILLFDPIGGGVCKGNVIFGD